MLATLHSFSLAVSIVATATSTPAPIPATAATTSSPLAANAEAIASEYRDLITRVVGSTEIDAATEKVLQRRVVLGLRSIDVSQFASEPNAAAERADQERLDALVVDARIAHRPLPVDPSPGVHESLVSGPAGLSAVASFVPAGTVRQMLVLLPGSRDTDTMLAVLRPLETIATDTKTLLIVPSLDGASTLDAVGSSVASASDAFANAYGLRAASIYLGGVTNGASLQYQVPLLSHRHFAGYLAIAGGYGGDRAAEILAIMRNDTATVYFVAGGKDPDLPIAAIQGFVKTFRRAGVQARYYEEKDGSNTVLSLQPSIASAWHDMVSGVLGSQHDGLGAFPGETP